MNGIHDGALTQRRGELSRAQLRAEGMQRVARGDLRMAPAIDEAPDAGARRRPIRDALGPEHVEPRPVDRLERQRELEARRRRGIELAGRAHRALPIEPGAVTLKAQQPTVRLPRRRSGEALSTCGTESLGAFAFELAAWE